LLQFIIQMRFIGALDAAINGFSLLNYLFVINNLHLT